MLPIIQKDKLFDEILIKPAREYDTLCIVSGFATPSMVVHHLEAVKETYNIEDTNIKLIIGMTPNGISKPHHENFIKLVNKKIVLLNAHISIQTRSLSIQNYTLG